MVSFLTWGSGPFTKGRVWSLVSSETQQHITIGISLFCYCHCDAAAYWYPQHYQWFMDVNLLFCTRGSVAWLRFSHSCLGSTQLSRTRLDSKFQVGFRSASRVFIPRLGLKEQQPPGPSSSGGDDGNSGRGGQKLAMLPNTWELACSHFRPRSCRKQVTAKLWIDFINCLSLFHIKHSSGI